MQRNNAKDTEEERQLGQGMGRRAHPQTTVCLKYNYIIYLM